MVIMPLVVLEVVGVGTGGGGRGAASGGGERRVGGVVEGEREADGGEVADAGEVGAAATAAVGRVMLCFTFSANDTGPDCAAPDTAAGEEEEGPALEKEPLIAVGFLGGIIDDG